MKQKQTGFTLIELVVVITIMGILSAIALPRFINLQTQARVAKAQAIFGSVRSAAALAKASCQVNMATVTPATCTTTAGNINMDGATIPMINQYPQASVGGIVAAAQLTAAGDGLTIAVAGTTVNFDVNGGTSPNCRVGYTQAAANSAPNITLVTTGC